MTLLSKKLGQNGENAAADYLLQMGYTLLTKNFKTRTAEIDIIAKDGDCLCFIEVKTRSGLNKGLPREAVGHAKQQKIISAALWYLKENKIFNQKTRFDVVEVFFIDRQWQTTLIKNAFAAG